MFALFMTRGPDLDNNFAVHNDNAREHKIFHCGRNDRYPDRVVTHYQRKYHNGEQNANKFYQRR